MGTKQRIKEIEDKISILQKEKIELENQARDEDIDNSLAVFERSILSLKNAIYQQLASVA